MAFDADLLTKPDIKKRCLTSIRIKRPFTLKALIKSL